MLIRYGFNIEIDISQPTHIITLMDVSPDRRINLVNEQQLIHVASGEIAELYTDVFGNTCRRIRGFPGTVQIQSEGIIEDSGRPDEAPPTLYDVSIDDLPNDALQFLLASRYCETDLLTSTAWNLFGGIKGATAKVQAINDYVHGRLRFDYGTARPTRTAWEAFNEGRGVCRDFTHLAVTFCRCLNIPARYCNGYLGDIGVPPDPAPMDFNAWYEAYLGGKWYTFDARHNIPRVGRILIARGRDAMDIPMLHTFGPHSLRRFSVITEEAWPDRCPDPGGS
ncbi:transglutaminase-like domain-containing protein [Labrys okinawensis]|uniref:transglutaminase-like domain-containing protein n=1 Tax=Labrys okinawensis TaxID=346911 RepID=UPI0039BD29E1